MISLFFDIFNYFLSSSASRTPECKRRLETKLRYEDTPQGIAQELSRFAFISSEDVNVLTEVIEVIIVAINFKTPWVKI